MKKPAIFLDRDGTLNLEVNYLSRPEDLVLFPFSSQAVRLINQNDFWVILITNQSGIERGFFTLETLGQIHQKLIKELKKENALLDGIYFCPHISETKCSCRKPEPGMIENALKDFDIDLQNSWMIGDKAIDIETGHNAKTKTALVQTGYGKKEILKLKKKPDLIGQNVLEIIQNILKTKS